MATEVGICSVTDCEEAATQIVMTWEMKNQRTSAVTFGDILMCEEHAKLRNAAWSFTPTQDEEAGVDG